MHVCRQALGRLPWFAPFFLRARRLRPVLPMWSSYVDRGRDIQPVAGVHPLRCEAAREIGTAQSRRVISTCTWRIESITR